LENAQAEGKKAGALFFDLSSVFDLIDMELLTGKLGIYGADATTISWIKSYLEGRLQAVC
jgi:hypothetical protein